MTEKSYSTRTHLRIIKENKFAFSQFLSEVFDFYIDTNAFPYGLKKAGINPVNKKDDPFKKTNRQYYQ